MSSVIKNMNHCEDPNQIQYAFVALRFYCSAVIIFRWLFQAMVRFFYFKDDFDILCKVKLIQLYNSLMRKKHTWMVHVVLFFKMSFGSGVVGETMEPTNARKLFLMTIITLELIVIIITPSILTNLTK